MTDIKSEVEAINAELQEDQRPLLEQVKVMMDEARQKFREAGEKYVRQVADEVFAKYEKLEDFGWMQYTPYFNDGDTCEFSVHLDTDAISLNGGSFWGDDDEDDETDSVGYQGYFYYITENHWRARRNQEEHGGIEFPYWINSVRKKTPEGEYETIDSVVDEADVPWRVRARQEISDKLSILVEGDDGLFKTLFGDHVSVRISRTGYEVEEYEHD